MFVGQRGWCLRSVHSILACTLNDRHHDFFKFTNKQVLSTNIQSFHGITSIGKHHECSYGPYKRVKTSTLLEHRAGDHMLILMGSELLSSMF